MVKTITIFTDGGARGNPGPAASGVHSPEMGDFKLYLGETTNNQAEYRAVLLAMQEAVKFKKQYPEVEEIQFFLDSELIVKQMKREYRVRDLNLQKHFVQIWNLMTQFKKVTYTHVPRAQNKQADRLVNEAIDEAFS